MRLQFDIDAFYGQAGGKVFVRGPAYPLGGKGMRADHQLCSSKSLGPVIWWSGSSRPPWMSMRLPAEVDRVPGPGVGAKFAGLNEN